MEKITRVVTNLIFCVQILLLFLIFVENRIALPPILQVAGRMHPLILHVPIGIGIFLFVLLLMQKHLDSTYSHKVIHVGLLLTSLSTSLAALFGFFLSLQGDYGGEALATHKISGVILSWLCYVLLLWHTPDKKRLVFFTTGTITVIMLFLTGHTGSVLTHGENFLFEPITGPEVVLTAENASVYDYAIAPILEKKCYSCHNETKAKGKLIMTDVNKFVEGGEHGKPWVVGNPAESRMIKAFYLPLDHDEHMPPDGKAQLSALEIATLKAWIKSGADFRKKLDQFPPDDSLNIMVAALVSEAPVQETEKLYTFSSASEESIEKVNTPFVTVSAVYQNSPALQAEFYVKKGYDVKALEQLKGVENQLVSLSLSKMPVKDNDLKLIAGFKNLETLNLNFSEVHGDGLKALGELKNLRSLSLAGTAVTAHSLAPVLVLPALQEIYLWSTRISETQRDSIMKQHPQVAIVLSQFRDDLVLKLNKPLIENEGILKAGDKVAFKHAMSGVVIRYTTDGTTPDSVKGSTYAEPFALDKTTVVKAVGCKTGWYCSDPVEMICFVKGKSPDHMELLSPPDPFYPGEGVQSLTDERKGIADVLKEPSWLGYRKTPFEAGISFENDTTALKEIVLSYALSIYQYSFPPKEVEVWAGESKGKLKLIRKLSPEQPKNFVPVKVGMISIPLDGGPYKYYKVMASPIPVLPKWFSKKPEKGWVFVDEMFFY